jgi:hypothetical protein
MVKNRKIDDAILRTHYTLHKIVTRNLPFTKFTIYYKLIVLI